VKIKCIIFLFFTLVQVISLKSQENCEALLIGDTVNLSVSGYNGSIQWQQSSDCIIWTDIVGFVNENEQYIVNYPVGEKYIRVKITNSLICEYSSWFGDILKLKVINSTNDLQVGDRFHGGIVFYINGLGEGVIAPQSDQYSEVQWGCFGTNISGASSTSNGFSNTNAIVTGCATRPIAASICDELNLFDYSDWYLPAIDQMEELYIQKEIIGGFTSELYWSSSEVSANNAWNKNILTGESSPLWNKNQSYCVRCIRSFNGTEENKKTFFNCIVEDPQPLEITAQPTSMVVCKGDNANFFVVISNSLATFQWIKDGEPLLDSINSYISISDASAIDEGIYKCEITDLCSNSVTETINAELNVIYLEVDAGDPYGLCTSDTYLTLHANTISSHPFFSGEINYLWAPSYALSSTTISNPIASPSVSIEYKVYINDEVGCSSFDSVFINKQNIYNDQQICVVSFDKETGKNKIMWVPNTEVGTEKYIIKKQISPFNFYSLGEVLSGESPIFIDYTSNPSLGSSIYKLSVIDTCGTESNIVFCEYHKTIHLDLTMEGSDVACLTWEPYEVQYDSFIPEKYYLYRGSSPESIELTDSIDALSNFFCYTEVDGLNYFMVATAREDCAGEEGSRYLSFSNIVDNSEYVGDNEIIIDSEFSVFPNPADDILNIRSTKINIDFSFNIYDAMGIEVFVKAELVNEIMKIDISNLKPGVYFIEINGEKTSRKKVVIY